MTISEKIYKLRQDSKLSQKEFALKVGTSQSAINYWENGKRQPRIAQIKKIAEAFDLPLYILTDEKYELWDITDEVIDAEKPKTQDLIIDTDIDPTHPYNIYWEKKRSGKELTEEEQQELNDFLASGFMHEVIERAKSTSIKFGESLKKLYSVYDQLNETGQEKVLEHAEMLAEIPKYRKGTTEEQE